MKVVIQVGAATLYRGARPTVDDLRQVKFDINLEVGWFEFFHGETAQERAWCTGMGVAYLHRPMSDLFKPGRREITQIIDQAQFWLFKGHSVLIHCLHGEDRTGIVCAAYRIKYQNWPVEKAIAEMYEEGFHKIPYKIPLDWPDVLTTLSVQPAP